MPFGMTLENRDVARNLAGEFTPGKVKDFAPAFLRLAQYDYDSVLLWRHDIPTANAVAEAFIPFAAVPEDSEFDAASAGPGLRGLHAATGALASTAATVGRTVLGALGTLMRGVDDDGTPGSLDDAPLAGDLLAAADHLGQRAQETLASVGDAAVWSKNYGKKVWDNPELLADKDWWLENGISTLVSTLPVMAAYVASGGVAAAFTGFALESSSMYNGLLAEGMPDDAKSRGWSLAYGLVAGALESTGAASMFGGLPAVKTAFKNMLTGAVEGGVKQAVKHSAAHAGMGFLGEGGTEWLQNLAQAAFEGIAKDKPVNEIMADVGEAAKEVENFVLGGVLGGVMAAGNSRLEVRHTRKEAADLYRSAFNTPEMQEARREVEALVSENAAAQSRMAFAQSLEKAAAAADASAMRQADPALFEREAAKLIPEEAREVWLGVDTVQQFADGTLFSLNQTEEVASGAQAAQEAGPEQQAQRLEALGLTPQDVEHAIATQSGAVKVSTMRLLARFEGAEREALLAAAMPESGGMTLAEAREFDPQKRAEDAAVRIREKSKATAEVNRERTRLKREFVQAGYAPHMAEYYAALHTEQAKAFADRYGWDAVDLLQERSVVAGSPEDVAAGTLHHPLNAGVNLDAPVRVVTVQPQFAGQNAKVLRKRFPADIRKAVLGAFNKGVINEDTGKLFAMSNTDFQEHLKFDDSDAIDGLLQLEAVAALPELMRKAKIVESYDDKENIPEIKEMHRFQAALRVGSKDYSVKMTVKEYNDGVLSLDFGTPLKFYHHRLEKEMSAGNSYDSAELHPRKPSADINQSPAGNSTALSQGDQPPQPSAGIHEYSLRSLLEDVNDSEGNRFLQGSRGAVSFAPSGASLTTIFKNASDPSTPIHEGAHVFINDMIRVVVDGGRVAEQRYARDFTAVSQDARLCLVRAI